MLLWPEVGEGAEAARRAPHPRREGRRTPGWGLRRGTGGGRRRLQERGKNHDTELQTRTLSSLMDAHVDWVSVISCFVSSHQAFEAHPTGRQKQNMIRK